MNNYINIDKGSAVIYTNKITKKDILCNEDQKKLVDAHVEHCNSSGYVLLTATSRILDTLSVEDRIHTSPNRYNISLVKKCLKKIGTKKDDSLTWHIPKLRNRPILVKGDSGSWVLVMGLAIDGTDIYHLYKEELDYFSEKTGIYLECHYKPRIGLPPMVVDNLIQKLNKTGKNLSTYEVLDSIDPKLTEILRTISNT